MRNKGHDWGVDYWGLGVFLFEITYGYPPFYSNNPTQTIRKINRASYTMPSDFSSELSNLISKLLKEQSKRLGRTKGGANEIIKHPWFSGFDWGSLLDKSMRVPWTPKLGNLESLGKKDQRGGKAPASDWTPVFDTP